MLRIDFCDITRRFVVCTVDTLLWELAWLFKRLALGQFSYFSCCIYCIETLGIKNSWACARPDVYSIVYHVYSVLHFYSVRQFSQQKESPGVCVCTYCKTSELDLWRGPCFKPREPPIPPLTPLIEQDHIWVLLGLLNVVGFKNVSV